MFMLDIDVGCLCLYFMLFLLQEDIKEEWRREKEPSNEALEIQKSALAEIDLESPAHYIEDQSIPLIDLNEDFLKDYTSNISEFEMNVFKWATTKEMVRGGVRSRGPKVYEADFSEGIIDKAGIQSMKPRGHLEDSVVQKLLPYFK